MAPGQRFRFEQYFELLVDNSISYQTASLLDSKTYSILYAQGRFFSKFKGVFVGVVSRILLLFKINSYDRIFIFREVFPVGPPIFEWLIAKVLRKKIIYDFDDAIWLEDPVEKNSFKALIKWKSKVGKICKWSYQVSVGNNYLGDFASKHNKNVVVNPTTIDTKGLHNPSLCLSLQETGARNNILGTKRITALDKVGITLTKPIIGWTGTHSTLQYLKPIIPVLKRLEEKYKFEFVVIANKNPELQLRSFRFVPWNKESEIEDLIKIDIGIMPLTDDNWSQGKCGFKLLQYMALKKPALASPIGVNSEIIEEGVNGYLCGSEQDWYHSLELLINDAEMRINMGKKGRKKIIEKYSVISNQANFLSLFE